MKNPRHYCPLCARRSRRNIAFQPPGQLAFVWICRRCIEYLRAWIVNVRVPGSRDT
jgi:hypothetical protein